MAPPVRKDAVGENKGGVVVVGAGVAGLTAARALAGTVAAAWPSRLAQPQRTYALDALASSPPGDMARQTSQRRRGGSSYS